MLQDFNPAEPETDTGLITDDKIYCTACSHVITAEKWRISRRGDHQHTVFNPSGVVFDIRVFKEAPGVITTGSASNDFSWFPGYSWMIVLCENCRNHIGWRFTAGDIFFGLIHNKLSTAPPPAGSGSIGSI